MMRRVDPDDTCDRCGHRSRDHGTSAEWSVCKIVEGRVFRGPLTKMPRAKRCWCDGFVPSGVSR